MYDLKKQTFVALTFATVREIVDNGEKNAIHFLRREEIIEVAAVKIKRGKIEGHFHSFIAIDGMNAHNLSFGDCNFGSCRAIPELLIGAPSFDKVMEKLSDYIGDSILLDIQSASPIHPLQLFKDKANSLGYLINNPTVSMWQVLQAKVLQDRVLASDRKFENLDVLQIAQMLTVNKDFWPDIFEEYEIDFDPESKESYNEGRDDPLSWALIFAKFFIKLVGRESDTAIDPLDDDCPFDV